MSTLAVDKIENQNTDQESSVVVDVLRTFRGLRFGSVVLTVHDGRVVEIHRTEKLCRAAAKDA